MPNRKNATLTTITALALLLTLAALPLIVLACTPTPPAGRTEAVKLATATPATTATAIPTATATTTATPTPAPDPTNTPTPTPIPTTNRKLEPMLNTLLVQSQSPAGQTTRMVGVDIDVSGTADSVRIANWQFVDRLVSDNGGSHTETSVYSVPVSSLPQLSAHSAIARVTVAWPEDFPYPKMSRALNNAIAVWRAGATPQEAASSYSALVYDDKILVNVRVADDYAIDQVEAFFTANEVYVTPELREKYLITLDVFVLVPVPLLASLSRISGIVAVSDMETPPVTGNENFTPEDQAALNYYLYIVLPPNLRQQLSPLPPEVWELEGIAPPGTPPPTPIPVSTPAPTPTATIIPTPAVNAANLGPIALALITLHYARTTGADQPAGTADPSESATSPIPPPLVPETLTLIISSGNQDATHAFLDANHGSIKESRLASPNVWVITAEVPLTLLPALSQQPHAHYAFVRGPYKTMPSHLNRLVMEYAVAQLTPAGTAAPDPEPVLYEVQVTEQGYRNVRRFLQTHGVPLTYSDAELKAPPYPGNFEVSGFPQLIPVHLLGPVAELPGVLYITEYPIPYPDVQP